ncbi:ATP-dependent DNA helicase [Plakobranchus ocellatus]|uniref:ATP-dependent DNA helicase n=1 Tax=Plakobranchus ocellatus TaxID=259542 RepID=A0AAV4DQN0_9GAST|nr:ATP-dependent DNA helicase [Plakobranchus ocellatus]
MLAMLFLYLTFFNLVRLACQTRSSTVDNTCVTSNVNKRVTIHYSKEDLRQIGLNNNTPDQRNVCRCAELRLCHTVCNIKPNEKTLKKTRRKSRKGRRKQRTILVNTGIPRDVTSAKNSIANINNLIHIDCRNVFQYVAPNFRLGVINAQSCRNKCETIKDQIDEMNIDLLCITESWLKEGEQAKPSLLPPGYKFRSRPRLLRAGGGLAFVYRRSIYSFMKMNLGAQYRLLCLLQSPYNQVIIDAMSSASTVHRVERKIHLLSMIL